MALTWFRSRPSFLPLALHADNTLPLSLPQLHQFCSMKPQLSFVKRSEVIGAGGSLRGAIQHLGRTPFHWGYRSRCLRCGGSWSVHAGIIKLAMEFNIHGLSVHCWITGHFLFKISTTVPITVGGQNVKLTDPQLRVAPTFHLDIQRMLLLCYRISHPIFHHFSEGGRVMKDKSPAPAQEPAASSSAFSLPCSPAGNTHVVVWLIRILWAPIVWVQKLQSWAHMHLLINTQNSRMLLQHKMCGLKKEERLPKNNSHAFLQACVLMAMSA